MIKLDRIISEKKNRPPKMAVAEILPVMERIKNFPTTRYCGSKRRLLGWIFENIKSVNFDTVLDAFGGTGSVSLLFKAMGKHLTYHDAFLFNKHVAKTVLADKINVSRDSFFDFVGQTVPRKGMIYKTFENCYYLKSENCWLDGFLKKVFSLEATQKQRSLYLYTLFQACLKKRPFNLFHRPNLNLRLNREVTRTFGNASTWERSFPELMLQSYDEIAACLWKGHRQIKILEPSDVSTLNTGYDLVYLDPPYIHPVERYNADNYWLKYHFLEGLSQYEKWREQIDSHSRLKAPPVPKPFIDWSEKETFAKNLFDLIRKHRRSTVVLSYVSDSYPDENSISRVFKKLFPTVSIHSTEHTHALSKSRKRELLFIGRPRCRQ